MKRNIARDVLGGQFLTSKFIMRNWILILYIFVLILFYISIHMGMRSTMVRYEANEETIKNLRSEYLTKYNSILYQSKRSEIEELLDNSESRLVPPSVPPTIIELDKYY